MKQLLFQKKRGLAEFILPILLFTVVCCILLLSYRIRVTKTVRDYVQDGLTASNLSAAIADLEVLGSTNEIQITNYHQSFNNFKKALQTNLNLDDSLKPHTDYPITSSITIEEFYIYNVIDNSVIKTIVNPQNSVVSSLKVGEVGNVATPDGSLVEGATIYSKIGFDIKSFGAQTMNVKMDHTVDISAN